ncbi:hypothetical protein HMPREF0742_02700 [Rothia aeria F0184]|uniref:Uncharacterized protein n=1 Tax=Rothia aeria F0184 TaxID=888019 RepID=U7UV34_9MICC|nr:hypothetical protein HMPREF0742_02700 [Rothia aeria F0184]
MGHRGENVESADAPENTAHNHNALIQCRKEPPRRTIRGDDDCAARGRLKSLNR